MKKVKRPRIIVGSVLIAAICLAVFWYISPYRVFWSFDHIEQRAKKKVTGTELQQWALQVLERNQGSSDIVESPRLSELPVPLPGPLVDVYHYPPYIFVFHDTNTPPGYIRLVWGGGFIGHCGFDIGPTNFVSSRGDKWQDGVYFWKTP